MQHSGWTIMYFTKCSPWCFQSPPGTIQSYNNVTDYVSCAESFAFSMSWNMSENPFNVKFFCQFHFPGGIVVLSNTTRHLTYADRWWVSITKVLEAYLGSQTAVPPTFPRSVIFCHSTHVQLEFWFHGYHFLFLCCTWVVLYAWVFFFFSQFSFNCLFLQNVTWIYHWETRRELKYTLCCQCVNGIKYVPMWIKHRRMKDVMP